RLGRSWIFSENVASPCSSAQGLGKYRKTTFRLTADGGRIERIGRFRSIPLGERFLTGRPSHYSQPWASRTLSIVSRIVFQVDGVSSIALGNMHPSQQMC